MFHYEVLFNYEVIFLNQERSYGISYSYKNIAWSSYKL